MKRLIIRWALLALFLVALGALFVRLGEWQLDRLEQRREANAVMEQQRQDPVVGYLEAMGGQISDGAQWQRVAVTGTYEPDQYQVRYRSHAGAQGIEVVAVLETAEGHRVLVDRGFIPREAGQPEPDALPAVPSGEVEVVGYLRRSERGADNAITPNERRMRLINAEAIAQDRGQEILDGYISLIESEPDNGPGLTLLEPPPPEEGNHFSYALQWFAFSAIAVGGIVVLVRADLKDHRKAKAKAAKAAEVEADPSGDAAPAGVVESSVGG